MVLADTTTDITPPRQESEQTTIKTSKQQQPQIKPPQSFLSAYYEDGEEQWVSPFTPEKVDPRALMKKNPNLTLEEAKKQIDAGFPTKGELRALIPDHCFEKSLVRSMGFLVRDLLQGALVVYVTHSVLGLSTEPPEGGFLGNPLTWLAWRLAWNLYTVAMIYAVGGLWVIGHECGHGAFSNYPVINGLVGWTLHSTLLVPYFSWAFSHAKHHRRTNDMIDGETHIPTTAAGMGLVVETNHDNNNTIITHLASNQQVNDKLYNGPQPRTFIYNFWFCHAQLKEWLGDDGFAVFSIWERLFVAFYIYMMGATSVGEIGADGKPIPKGTFADHFRPNSRLFPPKMHWKVIASDIGIATTLSIVAYCSYHYGVRAVWFWYGGPYLGIQAFLVATTWLHHTNPSVPQFDAENWSWIKGSLAGTIDRPMGFWTNYFSHNISSTHITHHLFHQIPHYHAVEATACLRAYLEPKGLYNFDPVDMDDALWRVAKTCHFVMSTTQGVQYYKSLNDLDVGVVGASDSDTESESDSDGDAPSRIEKKVQ